MLTTLTICAVFAEQDWLMVRTYFRLTASIYFMLDVSKLTGISGFISAQTAGLLFPKLEMNG